MADEEKKTEGAATPTENPDAQGGAPGDTTESTAKPAKSSRKAKAEQAKREKIQDVVGLRRTAKEVKRHTAWSRAIALIIGLLVAIVAVTYIISYFY